MGGDGAGANDDDHNGRGGLAASIGEGGNRLVVRAPTYAKIEPFVRGKSHPRGCSCKSDRERRKATGNAKAAYIKEKKEGFGGSACCRNVSRSSIPSFAFVCDAIPTTASSPVGVATNMQSASSFSAAQIRPTNAIEPDRGRQKSTSSTPPAD